MPGQAADTSATRESSAAPAATKRHALATRGGWRWQDLGVSLGLAATLLVTWIWPQGRTGWDFLDQTVFRLLNGLLDVRLTLPVWAAANHRVFDLIGVLALGGLLLASVWNHRAQWRSACISAGLIVLLALTLQGFAGGIRAAANGRLDRLSPSLVEPDARRLSALFPQIKAKDASRWSFPGDHGIVVLTTLIYLGYRDSSTTAFVGCGIAPFWIAPRLVSGAHWFTDIAVGSLTLALVGTALLMATPLHDWLVSTLAFVKREPRGVSPNS